MKRLLLLAISIVFYAGNWIREAISHLLGLETPGRCTVIYYHAVPDRYKVSFENQMDALSRFAEAVPAGHRFRLDNRVHHVAVTFDDAYRNILKNALPSLRERRIHATIFVAPSMLGKRTAMSDRSVITPEDRTIISVEELRALPNELISIGSHSLTHPLLTTLNSHEAKRELSESRHVLEQMLHQSIRLFCFPYGASSERLLEWCHEAGYERVFTTAPQWGLGDPDEFVTGRVRVDPSDWPLEFGMKIRGAYRWLPAASAMKRKLFPRRYSPTAQQAAA